ncbi:MAG: Type III pantothenate kinase [Eubacteriales bacterium SKADARSKE-1]|nr:Type III pantothenate kinase [Eubacteriales bacterium SKADARSKE-1]
MILVIDIGNTNVTIGVYKNDSLLFVSRLHTKKQLTKDQCIMELTATFHHQKVNTTLFKGAIISSVVPSVTDLFKRAIKQLINIEPIVVSLDLNLDLPIKIRYPKTLGSDLIAGAVGAINKIGFPCIVVDLGTATTFSIIDKNKNFIGVSIAPGVKTSFDSLVSSAELLSFVDFDNTIKVIGTTTSNSINSGLIYGTAAMIDGMCDRIEDELGYKCKAIATGGFSKSIIKNCKREIMVCNNLLLEGLKFIYDKNTNLN